MCLSETEAAFRALYARNGGKDLRSSAGVIPKSCGGPNECIRSGKNRSNLLRGRLDATFERSADHSDRVDFATSPWKHRTAGRWDSRVARPRLNSRLDRHSDALRHFARLSRNAAPGKRRNAAKIFGRAHYQNGPLVEHSRLFHQLDESVLRQTRGGGK